MKLTKKISAIALVLAMALTPIQSAVPLQENVQAASVSTQSSTQKNKYVTIVNSNKPKFSDSDKKRKDAFEKYSNLDKLGRCGVAYANLCKKLMPTGSRGDISKIHPSGWQYNMGWERCHLIGWQLAGENANEKNLITGTHQMNVSGMLPFENMIADYIKETNNHVLYRVTPKFKSNNLVATGVQMEAWSVEDKGEGICFNVFVPKKQDGCVIDYKTGVVKNSKKQNQAITGGKYYVSYAYDKLKKSDKVFFIGVMANGYKTYKKKSGSNKISVRKNGKVVVKKGTLPGTYKALVSIKADSTEKYNAKEVEKYVTVKVRKMNQSIWGGNYDKTYAGETVNRSAKAFYISAKCNSGKITYKKLSGNSAISIAKNGKVEIEKVTPAGKYYINERVKANKTALYSQKTETRKLKITVNSVPVTPAPTPDPNPISSNVWISATGSKYHRINNCGRMNPSTAVCISESDAIARGFERCSKCY